ncbi:hypothetical protein ACHAWF_003371 [Thalassiosira exigua]
MDIKRGHCNGTRYLVKAMGDYRLVLTKMGAKCDDPNKILILPRIPMSANDYGLSFKLKRLQLPVKLAFALTTNRVQGQYFDKCGVLLPRSIWTHRQPEYNISVGGSARIRKFDIADWKSIHEECSIKK